MLVTRYALARDHGDSKDVLEVACGSGIGLGMLARRARRVVGGDFTDSLLRIARRQYGVRIPLVRLDAQALPFARESFDVVLLYEAIYYLRRVERFLAEAQRVLRPEGALIVCTVNREWSDFNPSPFSSRYYSASELIGLFEARGFCCSILGGFPVGRSRGISLVVSLLKRTAVALRLIPKTMKGKQILKRFFLGRLTPLPAELTDSPNVTPETVTAIPQGQPANRFKVIYAVGTKSLASTRR
jgi:SAM-dependent methyltransferase